MRPHTLVWIDSREAVIARDPNGEVELERIDSDVPDRRRSTGHVRRDPTVRHGGGGGNPQDAGEAHRREHLARFLRLVADRLPITDDLTLLGPGNVREYLERDVRAADRRRQSTRSIASEAAAPMTDRQLVARLRQANGTAPRRRVAGRAPATIDPGEEATR